MKPYPTAKSKKEEVREMFDRIAPAYDRLNRTLSFRVDMLWRRRAVRLVRRAAPRRILDVATGTGDLAIAMAARIPCAQVVGIDLSERMLAAGRRKVLDRGLEDRVRLEAGDAERLAQGDGTVDAATVAFGVRNFGDLEAGLRELHRVLRPGGLAVILEFSTPTLPLFRTLYRFYSHRVLPVVGGRISKDRRAYEYLPASVDAFPSPEAFMTLLERAGFVQCRARSQSFGIAQLYTALKPQA